MKELVKLVVVLTVFCLVSGFLLAWTNSATKAPIEAARKAETMDALKKVLPACDNDLLADAVTIRDGEKDWTFYPAKEQGRVVGVAFRSESMRGYGGRIVILAGTLADHTVTGIEILEAEKETPGLGARIRETAFRDQFKGRAAGDAQWARVKKDGGDIVAITGATISSRAVSESVRNGLEVLARHESEINGGTTAPSATGAGQ